MNDYHENLLKKIFNSEIETNMKKLKELREKKTLVEKSCSSCSRFYDKHITHERTKIETIKNLAKILNLDLLN